MPFQGMRRYQRCDSRSVSARPFAVECSKRSGERGSRLDRCPAARHALARNGRIKRPFRSVAAVSWVHRNNGHGALRRNTKRRVSHAAPRVAAFLRKGEAGRCGVRPITGASSDTSFYSLPAQPWCFRPDRDGRARLIHSFSSVWQRFAGRATHSAKPGSLLAVCSSCNYRLAGRLHHHRLVESKAG